MDNNIDHNITIIIIAKNNDKLNHWTLFTEQMHSKLQEGVHCLQIQK